MSTPVPLLGKTTLTAVQQIDHAVAGGFEAVDIPGLDGDALQRAGRGSHRIWIRGILAGDDALTTLGELQRLAASGEEISFAADITTALELERVVVAELRAQAVAGTAAVVGYDIHLVESPPLPPPAEVSGFGGLGEFGIGDLGFDTDITGDIADLAGEVASAVDDVSSAVDAVSAVAAGLTAAGELGSLDVAGIFGPLADVAREAASLPGLVADLAKALEDVLEDDA
jgi:hypothetical protein